MSARRRGKRTPGATLQLKGLQWVICFRDPRYINPKTGYPKTVRKSLKTTDGDLARRYKAALDQIIAVKSYWKHIPKETPKRIRDIWLGPIQDVVVDHDNLEEPVRVEPLPGAVKSQIVPSISEVLAKADPPPPHLLFSDDPNVKPFLEAFRKRVEDLNRVDYTDRKKLDALAVAYESLMAELYAERAANNSHRLHVEALEKENGDLERQNKILHTRLSRYETKELRQANVGTLREEFERYEKYIAKQNTTRAWRKDTTYYVERFLKAAGDSKPANEVSESFVQAYVAGLKGSEGQRVSEGMRKRSRALVCRFLEFATRGAFRRTKVATVKEKDIRREIKQIVWLEKAEVERLIRYIPNDKDQSFYWRDVARVQAAMGWRPSELLLLQRKLANDKVVALEPIKDPVSGETLGKTGGRSVRVPKSAQAAVRRRIKAGADLLFPKLTGTNRRKRGGLLSGAWVEAMFCKEYRKVLRAAAKKAQINKPIDSRTMRRTFGSLQLRAGRKPHEVAELMGDRVETVKRHYARLLAHEIDTEV